MAQVLDYSAGLPGAANIARAGFNGAARYIGFPERRKCTNRNELDAFSRTGLGMALVFQDGTGDFLGGYSAGQQNARVARLHADVIEFPRNRPVYMAIDRDVVAEHDFGLMLAYLNGAGSVLGAGNVGVYGEFDVVRRALEAGHASFGWQTAAWSSGRHYSGADLYQRIGSVQVGGISCDVNDVLSADWGQHNYERAAAVAVNRGDTVLIRGSAAKFHTQAMAAGGLKTNLDASTAGADPVLFPRLDVSDAVWNALEQRTIAVDAVPGKLDAILGHLEALHTAITSDLAATLAPLIVAEMGPLVGLTQEQAQTACDTAIRAALGRGAGTGGVGA